MNVIDLRERQVQPLAGPHAEQVAYLVLARHGRHFAVTAPGPLDGPAWTLCSEGLVGVLPLDGRHTLRIAPKVPIARIVAMLDVAYDLNGLTWYDGVSPALGVDGLFETFVGLLCRRIADRTRKGLYRAYVEEVDELQVVRGRVMPRESMARAARGGVAVVCEYEELTDNLPDNQILLWTLDRLRLVPLGRLALRRALARQHRLLAASLELVPFRSEDCAGRVYHQLNHDYRAMHALCRMLLAMCGTTAAPGSAESIPFTIDMERLFEAFVARWLAARHPGWIIDPQHRIRLGEGLSYPVDIVVRERTSRRPVAVLDTKYKDHDRPSSDDVQQVVFYATALGCHEAWLVYPRPVHGLVVKAGPVTVRTFGLDLGVPGEPTADALETALGSLGPTVA